MALLDSALTKLLCRSFNGSARIRGLAATGKTVVGLHRAAYLARSSGGRVLFRTGIGTLPNVLKSLPAPEMVGADDQFYDIEGVGGIGDATSANSRPGPVPAFHRFASRAERTTTVPSSKD
ncbi:MULTISPECIES: hypothetical protein [unclassified Curtobacterium]|uniref:hypothetical protein n=1 Tax=unclassified Curtobacterium TaxID=257496 RepID=UPI0039B0DB15